MSNKLPIILASLLCLFLKENVEASANFESNTIERTVESGLIGAIPRSMEHLIVNFSFKEEGYFEEGEFEKGYLNYSGRARSNGKPVSIEKGIDWELWKGNELIAVQKFEEDIAIHFKKNGYIEFESEGDKINIKGLNANIDYQGQTYPLALSQIIPFSITMPAYILTESGDDYYIKFRAKYTLGANAKTPEYEMVSISERFMVRKQE
jgi:hypothetical protein